MSSRWYRSLYWRIAIGFVLGLAALLVVQAVLFVWAVARAGPSLPGQPPDRFAQTLALDLAQALDRDPRLDVGRFVDDQYGQDAHPFFVMMADGTVVGNGGPFPEPLLREARGRLERPPDPDRLNLDGRFAFGRGGGRGGAPFRARPPTPVVVRGQVVAVVAVLPRAPFGFLLGRYAPTLALVATGVLGVGALLATVVIFGPARTRLRAVEDAARRLGGGDLTARAPDQGGDEVAAVATAFNAMADDLSARADALVASDRARRQLLADVSHELTTPITAMRGYLETLTMHELALDERTRAHYLGIVSDETARLERIVGDLLDLARLEGGGGSLAVEAVPVQRLFDRVVARHERAARDASVALIRAVAPGAEHTWGDRDRLEQALQNLAANALRYAPPGTTIELRAEPTLAGVAITVSDHGPGIAPEHLPHVFDRFYKAAASRAAAPGPENAGGSGLGLSIVKAIVERHGGTIAVRSKPGRTVFRMELPARTVA
jgi:two-component system OmpR family sensor kinase